MKTKTISRLAASALSLGVAFGFSTEASADSLSAITFLDDYNGIVFGNWTTGQDIEGNALAGSMSSGNAFEVATAGHGFTQPTLSTFVSSTSTSVPLQLYVQGNYSSSGNVNLNGQNLYIGGNLSGSGVSVGGSSKVYVGGSVSSGALTGSAQTSGPNQNVFTGVTSTVSGVNSPATLLSTAKTDLSNYSTQLSTLTSNSTVVSTNTQGSNTLTFTAAANTADAVFTVTADELSSASNFDFSLNSSTKEVIINVTGSAGKTVNISANFDDATGKNDFDALSKVAVWNFVDTTSSTTINTTTEFGGDLLAVNANVTNGNAIDGTVVAENFTQNGELHYLGANTNLVSAVPLPAALPLFGAALFGLGGLGLRKRKAAQAA